MTIQNKILVFTCNGGIRIWPNLLVEMRTFGSEQLPSLYVLHMRLSSELHSEAKHSRPAKFELETLISTTVSQKNSYQHWKRHLWYSSIFVNTLSLQVHPTILLLLLLLFTSCIRDLILYILRMFRCLPGKCYQKVFRVFCFVFCFGGFLFVC